MAARERYWVHSAPEGTEEDMRPCARGEWCAERAVAIRADGERVVTPALGYRAFCDSDRRHIARCLDELPHLYEHLGEEIGSILGQHAEYVSGSAEPRAPLNLAVDALMRSIGTILNNWAARVRAVAHLDIPDPRRRPDDAGLIKAGADTLAAHLDALLALQPGWMTRTLPLAPGRHGQPARISEAVEDLHGDAEIVKIGVDYLTVLIQRDGSDAGRELMSLHYRCRSVLGETKPKPVELVGVPCKGDGCGKRALQIAGPAAYGEAANYSECAVCGHTMDLEEYRIWAKQWALYEEAKRRTPVLEETVGAA